MNNLVPLEDYGRQYKLWNFFEFDYGQNLSQEYSEVIYVDTTPSINLYQAMSTIQYDREYVKLNHDSIGSCPGYSNLNDFPSNLYAFSTLHSLKSELKNTPHYFDGTKNNSVNLKYYIDIERYKYTQQIFYGKVIQGEQYSSFKGTFVYPSNTNKQATWCNVFASDLSLYIYGLVSEKRAIPSGKNANTLNNYFNSDTKNYIEISNSNNIWRYVNNGYLVIFSKKESKIGHVEIGYPDPYSHSQYSNNGKNKYWNNSAVYSINNNVENICVGAGGHTGYKTTQSDRNWANSAQKFLYLEYLKQEFNH